MALIRQIWLLLLAALTLAWASGVAVSVDTVHDTLQTQLRMKNSDNAAALAQALSQQHGDADLMALAVAAQFDTGYYSRIRLLDRDGAVRFERSRAGRAGQAPAWFAALVPIDAVPGRAEVSNGWQSLGTVEVVSQVAFAYDDLWRGSLRSAFGLALVGLATGLLASVGVARIRKPIDEAVRQATLLQRGEYLTLPEPQVPELRRLTRAMNTLVVRLRTVFEAQAVQVESLRRQAICDPATGLANRTHFLALLDANLQREDGPASGGLVLLRVLDLAGVNRAFGRDTADRLIETIAQTLQTYRRRVDGAFIGRLNGADFALALPVGGMAAETAQAVVDLLRVALPALASPVSVAAGAVETRHGMALAEALGSADLALARAESGGPFTVDGPLPVPALPGPVPVDVGNEKAAASLHPALAAAVVDGDAPGPRVPTSVVGAAAAPVSLASLGARGWTAGVRGALAEGRVSLAEYPLLDRSGGLVHLECPLRLQLVDGGAFEVAAQWLPLALRARLTAAVDERAVELALQAIDVDGRDRCVNLAAASLADGAFIARLRLRLLTAPRAARRLWLEVAEVAVVDRFELLRELARQLRPTGVRIGIEHAGERLARMAGLFEAGLDYVKLDAALLVQIAADPTRAEFVRSLVALLHSLPLQVFAEGIADAPTAEALWACGIDGVTGPGVRLAERIGQAQ
jgi:diguanylate cyclase (GGDEF)-like protein